MNQIRPWLYIGKYRDTKNLPLLQAYHIEAMFQMAELVEQPDIITLYLDIDDGVPLPADMLTKGLDFIKTHHNAGRTLLVACGAGISRSATFAIATLKEIESLNLLSAYQVVKEHHSEAMPHPALWQSLCDYYDEDISFRDLIR